MRRRFPLLLLAPIIAGLWYLIPFWLDPTGVIQNHQLTDTDNYVYFTHALTWWQHGEWYNYRLLRLDPPHGTLISYSRLLELLILPHYWLWRQWDDFYSAIFHTAILHQIILLVIYLCLVLWAVRPLVGWRMAGLSGLAFLLIPTSLTVFEPTRVDHHALQLIIFAVIQGSLVRWYSCYNHKALGSIALLSTLSLMIGQETLPWVVLLWGMVVVSMIWQPQPSRRYVAAIAGLLLCPIPALLFVQPPWAVLTIDTTGYSIVYCLLLQLIGVMVLIAAWLAQPQFKPWQRLALVMVSGSLIAAGYFYLFPQMLAGPFGGFPAAQTREVLAYVQEAEPWIGNMLQPPAIIFMYVGLLLSLFMVHQQRQPRYFWRIQAVLLAAPWVGGMFYQQRMLVFAGLFAIVPLIWAMRAYVRWFGQHFYTHTNRVIIISLCLLGSIIGILCFNPDDSVAPENFCPPLAQRPRCNLNAVIPTLTDPAGLGSQPLRIMAGMNDGAALLLHTMASGHFIFAAPYHTVAHGNKMVRETFMATTAQAATLVRDHKVDVILLCQQPLWPYLKNQSAVDICHLEKEDSLLGDLLSGSTPPWLTELPLPAASHYKLFQTTRLASP